MKHGEGKSCYPNTHLFVFHGLRIVEQLLLFYQINICSVLLLQ